MSEEIKPNFVQRIERKSPDQLADQVERAEDVLNTDFFADTESKSESLSLSGQELKERYPYRYEQYLKILRMLAKKKRRVEKILETDEAFLEESTNQADMSAETVADFSDGKISDDELLELQKEFIPAKNYIDLINNLESYIQSYEKGLTEEKLREHQRDVFHDLAEFFNEGHREGYIEMPTGSGKTAVFVTLVKALAAKQRNGGSSLKTLILVPSIDLIHQTLGENKNGDVVKNDDGQPMRGFAAFAPELNATSYYMDNKDLSGEVVVSTYQSFIKLMQEGKIDGHFADLIICDEAHQALGQVRVEEISKINPEAIKIGLTATSEYSDQKSVSDLFPHLIHRLTINDAIRDNILAQPRGYLLNTGADFDDIKLNSKGDYPESFLKQLNNEARNLVAVDQIRQYKTTNPELQGVVSCVPGDDLAHARRMAELINEIQITDEKTSRTRNLIAVAVSGQDSDRDEIYERFERGEIDFLTFVDVLKEGWDSEKAKLLIRLRPTRSRVLATQICGRVLRKTRDNKEAMVIEFEDEFTDEENRPYTIFDILEQREINQGELIIAPDDPDTVENGDEGDEEEGEENDKKRKKNRVPRQRIIIPPEIIDQINVRPRIVRELVAGMEKLARGIIKYKDEIYLTKGQLTKYFDSKINNLDQLTEDGQVKTYNEQSSVYYEIRDIMRVLLDDQRVHRALGVKGKNKAQRTHVSLRVMTDITGLDRRYLKSIIDQHGLKGEASVTRDGYDYQSYDWRDLWNLIKKDIGTKIDFIDLIFKNRELNKDNIAQFCQQTHCDSRTLIELMANGSNAESLENITSDDKKEIITDLQDEEEKKRIEVAHHMLIKKGREQIEKQREYDEALSALRMNKDEISASINSLIFETNHNKIRDELRKIRLTEYVQGIDAGLTMIEKKWASSKQILPECKRIRRELQQF